VTGIAPFAVPKRAAGRRRPRAPPPLLGQSNAPDQFSFPSGHTITAFEVSTPIIRQFHEAAPVHYFLSASIAISRVTLGMHFPSKVLAGTVIETLLGSGASAVL
jgi:undecaprenyl-diphosphatase